MYVERLYIHGTLPEAGTQSPLQLQSFPVPRPRLSSSDWLWFDCHWQRNNKYRVAYISAAVSPQYSNVNGQVKWCSFQLSSLTLELYQYTPVSIIDTAIDFIWMVFHDARVNETCNNRGSQSKSLAVIQLIHTQLEMHPNCTVRHAKSPDWQTGLLRIISLPSELHYESLRIWQIGHATQRRHFYVWIIIRRRLSLVSINAQLNW